MHFSGIVIPTHITVNPDRTFAMELRTPLSTWFLKQAAGIRRGSERWLLFTNWRTFFSSGGGRDIAGKVTLKHIYEIAKVKSRDRLLVGIPLQVICGMLIVTSRSVGIEVIRDSDTHTPEGYRAFLETRKQVVSDQLRALGERKAAKMLRTATPAASTTSSTTI
jgi:large subunit ribosomal protein L11